MKTMTTPAEVPSYYSATEMSPECRRVDRASIPLTPIAGNQRDVPETRMQSACKAHHNSEGVVQMKTRGAEFIVIDLASDHQIERGLATEGQLIATLLHERGLGDTTRFELVASRDKFERLASVSYPDAKIVHVAAHASRRGLAAMGHRFTWQEVAQMLSQLVPPLTKSKERILVLSCCHSRTAYKELKRLLVRHFTAVYFFEPKIVNFDVAIMTWSMFYGKKKLRKPTSGILKRINNFFGNRRLRFRRLN